MQGILITHPGLESIGTIEVKEILKLSSKEVQGGVTFSPKKLQDLLTLAYRSQLAQRVMLHIGSCKVGKLEVAIQSIQDTIEKWDFTPYESILKGTFRVDCERLGDHDFTSVDIEESVFGIFKNKGMKVDFKNPTVYIFIWIHDDTCHIGVDLAGRDLSKRQYKIHNYGSSIKGTVAYGALRLAGLTKKMTFLDPSCGTGTIPIEAGLFQTGKSPQYYDKQFTMGNLVGFKADALDGVETVAKEVTGSDSKQKYVSSTKKNAKVAGVDITTSRMDIEWLDTKFDKAAIDIIVTKPLVPSKHVDEKKAEKIYKDLFYNSAYILKSKAVLAILSIKPEFVKKVASAFPFKLTGDHTIHAGHGFHQLLIYQKTE